jgi:hypothetical protein
LGFEDRIVTLDALDFDDYPVLNQQINSILADRPALVNDGYANLPAVLESSELQFNA